MNKKLYVVKNDEGKYLDSTSFWDDKTGSVFKRIDLALKWAHNCGGHVVTLIEEPEKLVLTKEQAEIVEDAHDEEFPATYISDSSDEAGSDEEELLMNAYVTGFTVAKEKKYNVKVPHTKDVWYYKASKAYLLTICPAYDKKLRGKFTEAEIEHYGLQDCEKEDVTDDEQ